MTAIKQFSIVLGLCLIGLYMGCIKPPDYPDTPVLTFKGIYDQRGAPKTTLLQDGILPRDTAVIVVEFTDGDGDLGSSASLTVIDTRDGSVVNDARDIPYVPEAGTLNGISGEMSIRIFGSCCKGLEPCRPSTTKPLDTLRYEIFIKDRAGNESNRILTSPITVLCQ